MDSASLLWRWDMTIKPQGEFKEIAITTQQATATTPNHTLCSFRDVTLQYEQPHHGSSTKPISLKVEDFNISPRSLIAVIGSSGSGKTTLAATVGNFMPARLKVTGAISRTGKVGLVSQDAFGALNPLMQVDKQVALTTGNITEARSLLSSVGLKQSLHSRYPLELSGGQRQRAAIAFALGAQPDLLLADEVTSALDPVSTAEVVETLKRLVEAPESRLSVLFISHDLAAAKALCPDVIELKRCSDHQFRACYRKGWQ